MYLAHFNDLRGEPLGRGSPCLLGMSCSFPQLLTLGSLALNNTCVFHGRGLSCSDFTAVGQGWTLRVAQGRPVRVCFVQRVQSQPAHQVSGLCDNRPGEHAHPPGLHCLPPCSGRGAPRHRRLCAGHGVASARSREAPAVSPVSGEAAGGGLNGGSESPRCLRSNQQPLAPGTGPALPPGATGPLAGPLPADPLFTPSQVSPPSSEGIPQVQSLLSTPEALASVSLPCLPSVGPQNSFPPSALLTSEAWSFSVHWGMGFFFGSTTRSGILVSCPGIEPAPPALEAQVLTTGPPGKLHQTASLAPTLQALGSPPPKSQQTKLFLDISPGALASPPTPLT